MPKEFPERTVLAYMAAAFMLIAGAAVEWRRTTAWGAAALTAYFGFVVVVLMNGRVLLAHFAEFLPYESLAIQTAITMGAADRLRCPREHRCGFGNTSYAYRSTTCSGSAR